MQLSTKFDVEQRVRIVEIAQPAIVLEIKYDGARVIYNLEYWWNGEIKSVWLYERELAALDTKERSKPAHNSASHAKAEYTDTPF